MKENSWPSLRARENMHATRCVMYAPNLARRGKATYAARYVVAGGELRSRLASVRRRVHLMRVKPFRSLALSDMSRANWIGPLYGYVVCIVAVITFLISLSGLVDAAFERAYPLQARGGGFGPMGQSLTSFEAFRASNAERMRMETRPGPATPTDTPSTAELRQRYETLRADRIESGRFAAMQRLVKFGLLMAFAVVLFVTHWRWLRGLKESAA
jgi:hypothetical protein